MKLASFAAVALVCLFFIASPGAATHSGCNGNVYVVGAGSETIYIDDRADDPNAPPGSGFVFGPGGTWIYLESNGQDGYQSGGDTGVPGGADACQHANPDQIVF